MRISKKDLEQRISALEKRVIELQDTILLMNKIQKNKYPFDISQSFNGYQSSITIKYIDKGEIKTVSYGINIYTTYLQLKEVKQINSVCYLITVTAPSGASHELYFNINQGAIVDITEEKV